MKTVKIMFFVLFAAFLVLCAVSLRPFGNPQRTAMDEHIIVRSQPEAACNNVVASIVFDYRGFDTLGESTVLFAAVSGIFLLFRGALE